MTANLVNVSGLVFDLIGAYLVVAAIAFAKREIVEAQSFTLSNGNPAVLLALLRQKQDAFFGLLFLVLGFSLQIVAALGLSWSVAAWPVPAAVLAIGLAAYRLMRWRLNNSEAAQQAAAMMELNTNRLKAR